MSRIDNIERYAQKKEEEKILAQNASLKRIEEYKQMIRELKPRIDKLLEVGNACLKYNISLTGSAFGGHEGYDTHQFISNSWSHLVGFITEYDSEKRESKCTKVGKIGGGACNYNLKTDGETIDVSGNVELVLKEFINKFDKFETEFYKYVDKVTAQ